MKKLFLLVVCSLLLFTGCGKKEEENIPNNNDNNETKEPVNTEKPIPEINNTIISELNGLLLESGSEQQFKYTEQNDKKSDYSIVYYYETSDKMKLSIGYDKNNKLSSITVYSPPDPYDGYNHKVTKDYINTKLFLIKLPCLNITDEDYNELAECTTGTKNGFCDLTSKNFMAMSSDEATDSYPMFFLCIFKDI